LWQCTNFGLVIEVCLAVFLVMEQLFRDKANGTQLGEGEK